jgi:Tfp pilus assembly protein PilN
MQVGDPALRKRQQIAKANRMMFIWVAGVSVVVGIAIVLSIFLAQKLIFNEKVLSKKQETARTLANNNKVVSELKENARVLNTNQNLLDSRAKEEDTALQVILDALPSEPNASALGSSLQSVLLPGDGIQVESLMVDTIAGLDDMVDTEVTDGSIGSSTIGFSFSVSVPSDSIDSLRELLRRLEKSIRAIDVQTTTIEMQGSRITLSASAIAYYEPAKSIELKTETVKPSDRTRQ